MDLVADLFGVSKSLNLTEDEKKKLGELLKNKELNDIFVEFKDALSNFTEENIKGYMVSNEDAVKKLKRCFDLIRKIRNYANTNNLFPLKLNSTPGRPSTSAQAPTAQPPMPLAPNQMPLAPNQMPLAPNQMPLAPNQILPAPTGMTRGGGRTFRLNYNQNRTLRR